MKRGLIRVTGLYLRGGPYAEGLRKQYIPNYKFLLYIDLRDFVIDDTDALCPLDNFPVIRKTNSHENVKNTAKVPPPPHIRVFNAVYAVAVKSKFLRELAEDVKEVCCFPGTWTSAHVKRLERQNYRPEHKIDKIAFIINKSSMATAHLENIFLNLDTKDYDIVFMGPRSELECNEKAYAQKHNCNVVSVNEVIAHKLCYKLAVTMFGDHKSKKHIKKYGLNFIAEKTLLIASIFDYTYSLEYLKKKPYDYIVCCGEFHKKFFEQYFDNKSIFMLGSPRFKPISAGSCGAAAVETARRLIAEQSGIKLNPAKKTLLLLPSYNGAVSSARNCATIDFLPILTKLQDEYNIIIKPHPEWASSWGGCKDFFCAAIPNAVFLNNVDNFMLYPAADFVVCDYSNVIFTTIHADKNIILFNAGRNDVEKNYALRNPVNSYLRENIINFYPDEEEKLFAALKDDAIWEKQKEIRRQIRADFFTDNPNPARDIAGLCGRIMKGEV
ncbi:MAG: CDP-glycerol glycerophosphotransferase family protein [Spirochaetaceae bacterium]|jgi:hypothetical protein|nr:CDP-glycerol glycerophosphotransferase family protein [Spirochaetaceae bacterium]